MSNGAKERESIGRAAWRGWRKNGDAVLSVAAVSVLVRAAALSPLLLPGVTGGKLPQWIAIALCAALWIFLVLPLRCWGGEKLRRMFYTRHAPDQKQSPYGKWLKAELVRFGRGALWGLPFLFCVGYFFYGKAALPYTKMWQPVMNLATLFGREPTMDLGLPIAGALVLLFGLIFAYGWWRDVMLEYLPVRSLKIRQAFHWARRMRRRHRGEMVKNTFVNLLLCVPALLGAAAALIPYVLEKVDFSLSTDMIVQLVMRLFKAPLPQKYLLLLLGVFAVLYLPLCMLRKTRNAALAGKLIHGEGGEHHHHHKTEQADGHAAG